MKQLELSIKPHMQDVDTAVVSRQPSLTSALILCQTISGLEDKEITGKGGVINDAATWSRIKAGSNNFPQDNLIRMMTVCQNEVPLIWLADRMGYELSPKVSEMERRVMVERIEKERLAHENALLRNLLVGRAA
jgi:hypothetical protein